jgi:hypothetical protein
MTLRPAISQHGLMLIELSGRVVSDPGVKPSARLPIACRRPHPVPNRPPPRDLAPAPAGDATAAPARKTWLSALQSLLLFVWNSLSIACSPSGYDKSMVTANDSIAWSGQPRTSSNANIVPGERPAPRRVLRAGHRPHQAARHRRCHACECVTRKCRAAPESVPCRAVRHLRLYGNLHGVLHHRRTTG